MTKKIDYGNKPFWINNKTGLRLDSEKPPKLEADHYSYWHSEFEFKVYQELLKKLPSEAITRQAEVVVLDGSRWFPPLIWTCDFRLDYRNSVGLQTRAFVEVKGAWILNDSEASTAFYRLMQTLAYSQPDFFLNFALVGNHAFTIRKGLKTIRMTDIWKTLMEPWAEL